MNRSNSETSKTSLIKDLQSEESKGRIVEKRRRGRRGDRANSLLVPDTLLRSVHLRIVATVNPQGHTDTYLIRTKRMYQILPCGGL